MRSIAAAKEHILAGDVFQLVLSQRFERRTFAEPFEVYRALRVVNPSPYMVYMQVRAGSRAACARARTHARTHAGRPQPKHWGLLAQALPCA